MGFFDAQLKSGIDIVLDAVEIDRYLAGVDLVITGEGRAELLGAWLRLRPIPERSLLLEARIEPLHAACSQGLAAARRSAASAVALAIEAGESTSQLLVEVAADAASVEEDAAWLELGWEIDLWKARERAAKEGKPIFLWEMDGHPLGCT